MTVRARRHIRKMRGGAQSHLMECDDGHFYVVKYTGNPQHRRVLSNELLSSALLKHLQISTPETAIVELTGAFIEQFPECAMYLGTRPVLPEAGGHFGSKYPGDPACLSVHDVVPDQVLAQVHNRREFINVLAFDKWTGNADSRQSIFFRTEINQSLPGCEANPRKMGFVVQMIDHGYVFNGPHWEFISSPVQGLYSRKIVYNSIRSFKDFQPGLDRIVHFPEHVLEEALRQIPPAWLDGDKHRLDRLMEALLRRRKLVPDLIAESRLAKASPFLNWPD